MIPEKFLVKYDIHQVANMPTTHVNSGSEDHLQEIAGALGKSKKVVVVTGAGISTNCGIPDFRSENGLYALIQAQYDAATAREQDIEEFENRPAKRRKLDRSCSLGSLPVVMDTPAPERRKLRSSQSFIENRQPNVQDRVSRDVTAERRRLRSSGNLISEPFMVLDEIILGKIRSARLKSTDSYVKPTPVVENIVPPEISSSQSSASSTTRSSLPNLKGKDLFDSMIWSDALTTSIFYTFISSLRQKIRQDVTATSETHKFIRILRDGGRLVRNYTQNIDMLEEREGLCTELERGPGNRVRFSQKTQKEPRVDGLGAGRAEHDAGVEVVHLHGKLDRLRCGLCSRLSSWDEEDRHGATLAGQAPECPWCLQSSAKREGKGRRSLAIGKLRPDIVLYGEEHPNAHLVAPLITHDLSLNPDILLILGTSLRVHGLKVMVKEFAKAVHGRGGKVIFVNQTKPPESIWGDVIDYWVEWDCDAWVEDLQSRRKDIWLPQASCRESTPKEEKPRLPAKNPSATRPDVTNGAHLTLKIMNILAKLGGRPTSGDPVISNVPRVLPLLADGTMDTKKRKSRPNATRDSKDNAAHIVHEIMRNLRQICGNHVEINALTRKPPLSAISANLPGRRALSKGASLSSSIPKKALLPTPPTSDQSSPEPPMTPQTQRIKQKSSISAILSSPISGGERLRAWGER